MSTDSPYNGTEGRDESDVAVLDAIKHVMDGMARRAPRDLDMALDDTAVFEIVDPEQGEVPLDSLWDFGTLILLDRCLWFTSDVTAFAIRIEDVQEVRIGGEVAVLTLTSPTGGTYQLGLGGYRVYAELICRLVEAVRDEHSPEALTASLEVLRDSVLVGSSD